MEVCFNSITSVFKRLFLIQESTAYSMLGDPSPGYATGLLVLVGQEKKISLRFITRTLKGPKAIKK